MSYYVYILKCADTSYYVGVTRNLGKRLTEHNSNFSNSYTSKRKPLKLVWYCSFNDINYAIAAEKQIKGWRSEKKEALIYRKEDLLPILSRRYKPN